MSKESVKSTYPMVNTIAELEEIIRNGANGIYSTLNFDMFEMLEYNRGEDNSIEPAKMREFENIFASGKYMPDAVQLLINKHLQIIDGTHKNELHRRHGIPINFQFTKIPELNSEDPVILYEGVATYNAVNSKWNSKAHFRTALKLKLSLALEIEKIRADYCKEYRISRKHLSANRIYSILSHDKARLESNMVTVKDYAKTDLIGRINDPTFKTEMDFVCNVLKKLEDWNEVYELTAKITPFNMIRATLPFVWENNLNMEEFMDEIEGTEFNKRFKEISNTVKGCIAFTKKVQINIINKK